MYGQHALFSTGWSVRSYSPYRPKVKRARTPRGIGGDYIPKHTAPTGYSATPMASSYQPPKH